MIYLASPYSHPSALMREWRFQRVAAIAAELMVRDIVFCPITHSHPIAIYGDAPATDWRFWARQDLAMLGKADKMIVARMPGWLKSVGVQAEIKAARTLGIPVHYTPEIGLDLEI